MNTNALLLAICAGLISAVVFASATTGPMLLRVVLFFLTPLSLYLAGLGLGPAYAAIAAATATLSVLLVTNPAAATLYGLSEAVPAVIMSRLALLSRGDDEAREWYPVGRMIAAAALLSGAFAGLMLFAMSGGDIETLGKTVRTFVAAFVKNELTQLPGAPAVTEPQIDEIAKTTLTMLPWALAILSMLTILINLWLAGRITVASGRLTRPWPDLAMTILPQGLALAFVAMMAGSFVGGMPGLAAGGFAAAFAFAFLLIGLAVVHAVTRGSPWRSFVLAVLYTAVFVFFAGTSLALTLLGLAEGAFGFRFRQGPHSPNQSN
ncbi:MAG: DUF2232 domain-containing protein [Rhodospirillales bacterium]|jgi:hypothetical protein|nr:DUF2232 domain-containing protein [Rhodospirillales bacterium]